MDPNQMEMGDSRTIETVISVDNVKDLVLPFLYQTKLLSNKEEVVEFRLGPLVGTLPITIKTVKITDKEVNT